MHRFSNVFFVVIFPASFRIIALLPIFLKRDSLTALIPNDHAPPTELSLPEKTAGISSDEFLRVFAHSFVRFLQDFQSTEISQVRQCDMINEKSKRTNLR